MASTDKTVKGGVSIKHDIIEKANSNTVIVVAATVFIVIFCLFALKTLFGQMTFQNEVISEKKKAKTQLDKNISNLSTLSDSYATFDESVLNILSGSRNGDGPRDGSNAKLVLDALPKTLDVPALASSFEKILVEGGYKFDSISGSEKSTRSSRSNEVDSDELNEIEYSFSVQGSTAQTVELINNLENSIRPIYIDEIDMGITTGKINASYTIRTFYAEEKTFDLTSKEVK